MCGLAGFFGADGAWRKAGGRPVLNAMTDAIRHRGPDAQGIWLDGEAGIGLGHRRLSILDLSDAGAQPMTSHDGRYVLCFNGEIYNCETLRRAIQQRRGHVAWRGHSDTEVLVEQICDLGVKDALESLDGMFALALFDRKSRRLTLARDPFGEKPLYYGFSGRSLVFASEFKALQRYPDFVFSLNHQAAADFFKYSYVPAPETICEGVFKLQPAHFVQFGSGDLALRAFPRPRPYWRIRDAAMAGQRDPIGASEADCLEALRKLMLESTRRRMASDVPLGALLSGGIDSSLVTALMQAVSEKPIRTFSIGMDEKGYNEAGFAKAVSASLGTEHTELVLSPADVQNALPDVVSLCDEPFGDSSLVPTYLVSRLARQHVTVALSGDGADEIFGGYNRYFHGTELWRRAAWLPATLRHGTLGALKAMPLSAANHLFSSIGGFASKELSHGPAAEKLHKLARVLSAADEEEFHDRLLATAERPETLMEVEATPRALVDRGRRNGPAFSFAERAMLLDTENYLPDDVLTKVDRASMAVSMEVRTPFLNKELFEFAWRVPLGWRVSGKQGKRILRQLLYDYVPREIVDRPKSGFAIPVGRWLRTGRLREWAEAELDENCLRDMGILNVAELRRRWDEHLRGRRNHDSMLWSVLMFQGWYRSLKQSTANREAA